MSSQDSSSGPRKDDECGFEGCWSDEGVKLVRDPAGDEINMCRGCRGRWPYEEVLE